MAKRFTDTEKYKKPFVRGLQGAYKLFWDYLYHDCNHAGIWHVDFEIAQIYLGKDMPVNKEDALKYFNQGKTRIISLDDGKKWFIKSFIEFQYGVLNPDNRVHKSAIDELVQNGVNKPLVRALQGCKDKDKDKDKEKGGLLRGDERFEEVYKLYPNRDSKKEARKHFFASVLTGQDLGDIKKALINYKEHLKREPWKKPKSAKTWFNNWQDWIEDPTQETGAQKESNRLQAAMAKIKYCRELLKVSDEETKYELIKGELVKNEAEADELLGRK